MSVRKLDLHSYLSSSLTGGRSSHKVDAYGCCAHQSARPFSFPGWPSDGAAFGLL